MTELYRTICGSAHDIPLPDASVQCIVTSPPFWGLRKYAGEQGVDWPLVDYSMNEWTEQAYVPGMSCALGMEPDPVAYIGHLILCLREWRRVLRDDGTLWLNLGDSYNGSGGAGGDYNAGGLKDGQPKYGGRNDTAMKPKDLVGIPWLFAFAARADGWYLRSDIVWDKPNPMPESVQDRVTRAHEYIFMLSKSRKYYYDADAVRETQNWKGDSGTKNYREWSENGRENLGMNSNGPHPAGRNLRSVWHIATQPTPYAHFATFPERIPETCIKAGSAVDDTVLDPFHGSGTTGIVALRLGRAYVGVDISKEYLDGVSEERMQRGAQIGMGV